MLEPKSSKLNTLVKDGSIAKLEPLCFDKNDFMKANFSVDEFLHKNRSAPSLEQLRDNLGLYLKGLRSSMIDLINVDYADFVSLSANLVGLDQTIDTIQEPLQLFYEEVNILKILINENEAEIRNHLEQKRQLRELKRNLQSLKKVHETMVKLSNLLAHQLSSEQVRAVDLERAALELIELKFNEKFCAEYLTREQQEKLVSLNSDVLARLRTFFVIALKTATSTSSENLERSLRIYITLDACHIAETAFKEDIVAPYMCSTISEHALQNSPQGLAGIYSKILNFISLHMTDLLRLTQYTDKLCGYNFLVNSFWADVEMRLETFMSSIFAPGNSEIFYTKYKCTREFLCKVEELLATKSVVREFRQHKQTKSFQARWNLPVYFQICFQEIAGQFEGTLEPLLRDDCLDAQGFITQFQLRPFNTSCRAIDRCWDEGVFLPEVFPKFYKLTLQIILRLSRWIQDVINFVKASKNTMDLTIKLNKTRLLVALHVDIEKFHDHLPSILLIILKNVSNPMQEHATIRQTLEKSFKDLMNIFSEHLHSIRNSLVIQLITDSGLENIRQVNDLPRLYRKTNRDVPSRSSLYVEQMLRPLKTFADQEVEKLGRKVVDDVLIQVLGKITTDYFTSVSDVLTSVQKTEESLRRLRNLKSSAATSSPAATLSSKTMSDDDKIRLQLRVDVIAWTEELAKLNFMPTDIEKLLDLNNIVDESIKVKETVN